MRAACSGSGPVAEETPAVAVIVHTVEAGSDWRGAVRRLAEAIAGAPGVMGCSVSLATAEEVEDLPFVAFVVAVVDGVAVIDAVAGTITPLVDPKHVSVLEVGVRPVIPYDVTWPVGQPTPGERVVTVTVRKPGMTREAFDRYWQDV